MPPGERSLTSEEWRRAPTARAARLSLVPRLTHTGQHGEELLTGRFFEDLDPPMPDVSIDLERAPAAVGSAHTFDRSRSLC